MRDFGKRQYNSEFAFVIQPRTPPISCRVVERTERILLLHVEHLEHLNANFYVALKNGSESMVCELVSIGQDYVLARYTAEPEAIAQALVAIASGLDDAAQKMKPKSETVVTNSPAQVPSFATASIQRK